MTDLCNSPSDECDPKGQADAPAVTAMPPARRLLWAFAAWLRKSRGQHRLARLHRLNNHMLNDIGLAHRESDHEVPRRFAARQEIETE